MPVRLNTDGLDALIDNAGDLAEAAQAEILERVAERARQYVHVISGETRDSIEVQGDSVVAGYGAVFEELGTVHREPHPFMTPAFEETMAEVPDIVRERIYEVVE